MIGFADWDMRAELAELWQICFNEPARPSKYFLNNYFRPENCLIYKTAGKIAAAVYLLPAFIASGAKPLKAHYIYAAGTLPQYRSHGYMAALLAWAALSGSNRGDQYSIVLPASRPLYKLYEKSDYTPFFKIENVTVTLSQMCDFAESGVAGNSIFTFQQLNALRNSCLAQKNGSVLWSDEGFAYAAGISKVYGDKLVCSRTGDKPSYALCRRIDDNTCKVMEAMAEKGTIAGLAANLIGEMPAQTYLIRQRAGSNLFGQGESTVFGMIKPLGGTPLQPVQNDTDPPYLGLSLD
jgi:hypothetical protein